MRRTNYALAGTKDAAYFEAPESITSRSAFPRLTWVDMALIALFMVGMYTNFTVQVSAKVPFPSVPAGVAGLILLWRRRDQITPAASPASSAFWRSTWSPFSARRIRFLPRRTNGLIQLTYSLIIGYALFLTVTQASRRQIAGLFLSFSLVILAGCLLEVYAGLRPVSDAVRNVLYSKGVYENDLRDTVLQSHPAEVLRLRTLQRDLLLHAVHLPVDGGEPLALEARGLCRPVRARPVRHAGANAAADAAAGASLHAVPCQPQGRAGWMSAVC